MLRVLKRNPLRCSLWQKRTFRKHIFIGWHGYLTPSPQLSLPPGQAVLQLERLETKCEVNGVLDLLDEKGRKPVGGKMEVVARLREPLSGESTS